MDFLLQLNRAIEYIEDNIYSSIDYDELAKYACSSRYHFSRMFSSLAGVTLSEYIRRRKLSLAAIDLQNSQKKIIDISMNYGYSSPDSFTRAFLKQHGITPTDARKNGESLKLYPRLTFEIKVKGDKEMDYRIEKIEYNIKIVGKLFVIENQKAKEQISAEYAASHSNGLLNQLIEMAWENPKCQLESIIGVIGESSPIISDKFNFIMGVRYEDSVEGMTSITIPPCTWAVFPNIEEAWKRLYTEWLPSSTYELADLPCLEHSLPPDRVPNNELWVPIKQK